MEHFFHKKFSAWGVPKIKTRGEQRKWLLPVSACKAVGTGFARESSQIEKVVSELNRQQYCGSACFLLPTLLED
jgi:hypothetical protein